LQKLSGRIDSRTVDLRLAVPSYILIMPHHRCYILEAAFSPNPQRVKNHIPKYHSSGNGRDFYVRDAQVNINTIPMTADVYRAGTFRRPKRRTKEINYPIRPPRYKMDGSGRDSFIFLHENVGKPKKAIFRTHATPWSTRQSVHGVQCTAPYSQDPRLRIMAKCANLRQRPCTKGVKLVAPRIEYRPTSALSPRMRRKYVRQKKSTNRLSQPLSKNVVKAGMYKCLSSSKNGEKKRELIPWLGNSRIKQRPLTASSISMSKNRMTIRGRKTFQDLDEKLLD
jgi:hypothetical protein